MEIVRDGWGDDDGEIFDVHVSTGTERVKRRP